MVKVAIVDSNEMYLQRLHNYWSKTYGSGALMVFVFSSYEQLLEKLHTEKMDIVLINNQLEADLEQLPKRILKIYLLPGKRSGEIDGIPALSKNGNADDLYLKMMELYDSYMNIDRAEMPGQMLFFTSPIGGCGTSSCAVGCGKHLAAEGKKVLYLNLENISAMELMLDGEPGQSMEELFYLCSSNRKNISFSLETMTAVDSSGLKYIAQCKNPLELKAMTVEDMKNMLTMVTEKGSFDVVIVDRGFSLEQITEELMQLANHVVLVTEETAVGRKKLEHVQTFLEENDHRGLSVGGKISILYNKSTNPAQGVPFCQEKDTLQVVNRIAAWNGFDELLNDEQ